MAALLISAVVGLAGLGAEAGLWYAIKRQNQSAADTAAMSGAMEIVANKAYPDICALAQYGAARNNFTFNSFTCPTTSPACTSPSSGQMCANNPPVLGALAGNAGAVEVILSQQQASLFASLYFPNVTIETRAVAGALSTPACLLALGTSGQDLTISGGSAINMPGCSAVTNSTNSQSVTVSGGSTLTAQTVVTSGNISPNPCTACTLTTPATTNAAATTDPYATRVSGITLPTASCVSDPHVTTTAPTPSPSTPCYQSLTFTNTANVTLTAGVYFVDGNLTIQGGTVRGSGVTFVVYGNGQIAIQNSTPAPTVTLSAPSTGGAPYQGLLFYQCGTSCPPMQQDNHNASFAGCSPGPPSSCNLTGAVYLPLAPLTYSGNSSSICTVLIASTITFSGSSTLNASQCGADGVTTPSNLTGTVALAE